jgi:hypothetical protein
MHHENNVNLRVSIPNMSFHVLPLIFSIMIANKNKINVTIMTAKVIFVSVSVQRTDEPLVSTGIGTGIMLCSRFIIFVLD